MTRKDEIAKRLNAQGCAFSQEEMMQGCGISQKELGDVEVDPL